MSSSKARSLRERMSIDPDAPEPVARPRRPRSAPTPDPTPQRTESASPGEQPVVADPPSVEPGASTSSAESTLPPDPEPAASVTPAPPPAPPPSSAPSAAATPSPAAATSSTVDAPAPSTRSASPSRSSSRRSPRRKGRDDLGWTSALDDPSVSSGGNGYRSFYVSDEVFARFRAAIYWTARRPDATDVPDNMSAGVEDYMDQVASDLERRFNGKDVFPPTPDQLKAHRRRETGR